MGEQGDGPPSGHLLSGAQSAVAVNVWDEGVPSPWGEHVIVWDEGVPFPWGGASKRRLLLAPQTRETHFSGMELDSLQFYNPLEDVAVSGQKLPHWDQAGAAYFLTFRLGDSLPAELLRRLEEERTGWQKLHPEPWDEETKREYRREFGVRIDGWLDEGRGSCVLREAGCRAVVEEVLRHVDGTECRHHAWVIMPNHVHLLCSVRRGVAVAKLVAGWKSVSARRIGKVRGQAGGLWQRDYFDRLIRDAAHFAHCVRYIRGNPRKAGLGAGEYSIYEGDWAGGVGDRLQK